MAKIGLLAVFAITILFLTNCGEVTIAPPNEPVVYPLADSMQWSSIEAIWQTAETKNPYSLLVFGATWCGWCHKLMDTTFTDKSVMGLVGKYFNACAIDVDQDSLLIIEGDTITCHATADRYGIRSVPMTLFFDRNGNLVAKAPGYYAPKSYADLLWRVVQGH